MFIKISDVNINMENKIINLLKPWILLQIL